jgi:hypothetical protein
MSVDQFTSSHITQAPSSPEPLSKVASAESIVWDIEIEKSCPLSPAQSSEIRNRPPSGSPTVKPAVPDNSASRLARSPQLETMSEEPDNLVELKSPNASLGPSQSASQYGRICSHIVRTIPLTDADSKYFVPTIPKVAQVEQQVSFEMPLFNSSSVFSSKQVEKTTPASYLDLMSPENRLSDPVSFGNLTDTINYLDLQVTQHDLAAQDDPDSKIVPCSLPNITKQFAICSWQPALDVDVKVDPDNRNDLELVGLGCAPLWDLGCSVDHRHIRDRHLWPLVDCDKDLLPLEHSGCDNLDDCDTHEYYLSGGSGGTNVVSLECDLVNKAELSDECMIDPILSLEDNGQHDCELAEGHFADWYLDSKNGSEYEECICDEHGPLELDDTRAQCHTETLDSESHVLWERKSTPSTGINNSSNNSSLSDYESKHLAAMFSQGRALLFGFTQEGGNMITAAETQSRLPLLSSVEADVATSLKNHWHPQKL